MLNDDWHTCLDDTPSHMQFILPSRGSWQGPSASLQQCEAWQQYIRPAHISNGWFIWHGFRQVLLEIMSGVVIFECCLQGLLVYLFYLHCTETEDAPIRECRGWHYLKSRTAHWFVALWSRYVRLRAVRGTDKWRACWADQVLSDTFWHSYCIYLIVVLTGLLEIWSVSSHQTVLFFFI